MLPILHRAGSVWSRKVIDVYSVENWAATIGKLRKLSSNKISDVRAAPNHQIHISHACFDHAAVELRQPFALHVKNNLHPWIDRTDHRSKLGVIDDMDDVILMASDVYSHLQHIAQRF